MKKAKWRHYYGAVHVHTDRSDGEGTLEDVVEAAKESGLDFVVITDHKTRGYGAEGLEGMHDGILVLCGEEVSTPNGHFLALETREDVGTVGSMEEALEEVHRQVGIGAATHLQLAERGGSVPAPPTLDFSRADAVELWSFTDEFLARANPRTILQAAARPDRLIMGPSRRLLNRWDIELGRRQIPAIGGLNAHQKKQPLLDWRVLFPYKTSFKTIQMGVLCRELPNVALRARDMLWEALRMGRSYIVNKSIAPAQGFEFYWKSATGKLLTMGQEGDYEDGGRIIVDAPAEAEIAIRNNGQPLFWGTGEKIDFPAPAPGVYRVEIRLNRRLWILTNAIRLTVDNKPIQPTVSDFT